MPLVVASMAYACSVLSTLAVEPGSGAVGQTIAGTGRSFTRVEVGNVEPVTIRFGSVNGPVLWQGRPDAGGNISFSFAVPESAPGQYTIIATQPNADGTPVPGTPARASFQVTGPAPQPVAETSAAPFEPSSPAPAPVAAPATPTAAATSTVRQPAVAPRVRVAPAPAPRPAAPAAAPASAAVEPAPAPAPVAAPAPAVTPAPESAPATAPARRSVMVSMSDGSSGSPALAIALVGVGLVLALGASALVLAGRRDQKAAARARR